MKNLRILFSFLLISIAFIYCKKDVLVQKQIHSDFTPNHTVSERSTDCRNIKSLCFRPFETPTLPVARVANGSGGFWDVYYFEMIEGEPTLLAKPETGESIVITKTENAYLHSKADIATAPNELKALTLLPRAKIQDGTLSINDFREIFGQEPAIGVVDGKWQIDMGDATLAPPVGSQNMLTYSYCRGAFVTTVMNYMTQLNIPISSQSTYEDVIQTALSECAGSGTNLDNYYCSAYDCHSECVVGRILQHPVISGSAFLSQQVKLYYVSLMMGGMDPVVFEQYEATSNSSAVSALYAYYMNPDNDICDKIRQWTGSQIPPEPILILPNITVSDVIGLSGPSCNKSNLVALSEDRHPNDEDLQFSTGRTLAQIPSLMYAIPDHQHFLNWGVLNLAACSEDWLSPLNTRTRLQIIKL